MGKTASGFNNPFSIGPALKYGLIFMLVLCFTRYVQATYGGQMQMIASLIGGLIDVDAVS